MPALYSHLSLNPKTDPVRKAQILLNQFFPPPSDADLSDTYNFEYEQSFDTGDITAHEIRQSILTAILEKAPGEDRIPNRILKSIIDLILLYLFIIFNACLSTGYCLNHFWSFITIILQKPGKPDYTIAKAYWPITFLNTIGKALEFFIAKQITYLAEIMAFYLGIILGPAAQAPLSMHYIILLKKFMLSGIKRKLQLHFFEISLGLLIMFLRINCCIISA